MGTIFFAIGIYYLLQNEKFNENPIPLDKIKWDETLQNKITIKNMDYQSLAGRPMNINKDIGYRILKTNTLTGNYKNRIFIQNIHTEKQSEYSKNGQQVLQISKLSDLNAKERFLLMNQFLANKNSYVVQFVSYNHFWWIYCLLGTLFMLWGFYSIIRIQIRQNQKICKNKADAYPSFSLQ